MTNYEHYKDELIKLNFTDNKCEFKKKNVLGGTCVGLNCIICDRKVAEWLDKEYEEPAVDWSKVEVDTRILVKNETDENWERRHFAGYEDGYVFAWSTGNTSYTTSAKCKWDYAKLAGERSE